MVVDINDNERQGLRQADANEKSRIGFLVNQHVLFRRCAESMTEDLPGAVVFVEPRIEKGLAVIGPDGAAICIGYGLADFFSCPDPVARKLPLLRPASSIPSEC